ncbi:serine hydrolase [Paenalkalicoccus suaedae]|uniref:Serine hydrolase n=1 Tax=Paenalkalicoccus suaedae TaxID=2592382 RepID=A0A859F9P0_9BACI|nr:serine hydrolase [Paenalkalicoccus suaedae]QKS69829.1 serine hydrolase [Paenalkalicoccus suaedae]
MDWNQLNNEGFSGTVHVSRCGKELYSKGFGYAQRAERTLNRASTRFSIASGSKIFTAVAICQLVESGKLTFETRLTEYLDIPFPHFDEEITLHHLLTHTAMVPDYFNEEVMDDFAELWEQVPMYHVRRPKDFLPLFQHEPMQGKPGSTFAYNNSGYVLLGLVIEQASDIPFTDYVEKHVFTPAGMTRSGYFEADDLPSEVATGYVEQPDGRFTSNIFSLPAKGGPDGGAYVTAGDIALFWEALLDGKLLSARMTETLMTPHVQVDDDVFYGYGGYMVVADGRAQTMIQMGYDPGVNYRATFTPSNRQTIVVCSNHSEGAYEMLKEIEAMLEK